MASRSVAISAPRLSATLTATMSAGSLSASTARGLIPRLAATAAASTAGRSGFPASAVSASCRSVRSTPDHALRVRAHREVQHPAMLVLGNTPYTHSRALPAVKPRWSARRESNRTGWSSPASCASPTGSPSSPVVSSSRHSSISVSAAAASSASCCPDASSRLAAPTISSRPPADGAPYRAIRSPSGQPGTGRSRVRSRLSPPAGRGGCPASSAHSLTPTVSSISLGSPDFASYGGSETPLRIPVR